MTSTPDTILALLKARKIVASISSTVTGPRLIRYGLAVAPEVALGRVTRLGPDLSAALGFPVRVTANNGVWVEVPRADPQPVPLLPLLAKLSRPLDLALGVDQQGQPVTVNLGELPHLIIAGQTGSGKSVSVKACILSLLQHGPDKVRLALVDLKRIELARYEGIPALIRPVAKEAAAAYDLLDMLAAEIDRRNAVTEAAGGLLWAGYKIVLVIDEVADLALSCPEILGPLGRIARLGRAAGIHMILAMQRADAAIMRGELKGQAPARLVFAVSSATDSRVCLDQKGAEQLLGKGDGLLRTPGGALLRLQGAMGELAEGPWLDCLRSLPADPFPDPRPVYVPPVHAEPIQWPKWEPVKVKPAPVVVFGQWLVLVWMVGLVLAVIISFAVIANTPSPSNF